MRSEFKTHKLNALGISRSLDVRLQLSAMLSHIEAYCSNCAELTIATRKLEEAGFYFQKAVAKDTENQDFDVDSSDGHTVPPTGC